MTSATPKPRAGEHTPGKWIVRRAPNNVASEFTIYRGSDIIGGTLDPIADVHSNVNARRIVACVNACEGIKTENLEHASLDFGKELRADLDEALDALTLLDQAENGPWDGEEQKRHLRTAWSVASVFLAKHGR